MPTERHPAGSLVAFAQALLAAAGMRDTLAAVVADVLVDADLMGHDTHGLALLPGYLRALQDGSIRRDGEPVVLEARAASQCWDAQRLPGPWITRRALDTAAAIAATAGTGTVVIRRSHHIACLAAYLPAMTARGLMALVYCSDPSGASVAPFGGVTPVFDTRAAREMGYRAVILPAILLSTLVARGMEVLAALKATHTHPPVPGNLSIADVFRHFGSEKWDHLRMPDPPKRSADA